MIYKMQLAYRQKIGIVSIILILASSCTTIDPYSEVEKTEQVPDLEKKLAELDGSSDSQPYFKVIDAIQKVCNEENRTAIASMASSMAKFDAQAAGESEKTMSRLDSLKLLYYESTIYAEASDAQKVWCYDVMAQWNSTMKKIIAEDKKQQEEEEIMNLGK